MSAKISRAAALLLAGALGSLATSGAEARTETHSPYSKSITYSGALRYLRVDRGYEITERDPDAAYLLFRYAPPGRDETTGGSVEIVETRGKVKVFVQLPQMPSYHERVLTTGLMKKLRSEYGRPPSRDDTKDDAPRGDGDDSEKKKEKKSQKKASDRKKSAD